MAIEDWMGRLVETLEQVEGVAAVYGYEDLPATLSVLPCIVVLPTSGSQQYGASAPGVAVHQVQMTLYTAAQVLPEAYGTAVPFIKRVRDCLAANVGLGGLVSYVLPVETGDWYQGPGALRYGDKEHVGVIFRARVKEVEQILVTL